MDKYTFIIKLIRINKQYLREKRVLVLILVIAQPTPNFKKPHNGSEWGEMFWFRWFF